MLISFVTDAKCHLLYLQVFITDLIVHKMHKYELCVDKENDFR